jgi:diguanylate cyclase (GGDEF)-like protein
MPYQGTKELTYQQMRRSLVQARWDIRRLKRELAYDKLTGLRKSHGYFSKAVVGLIADLNDKIQNDRQKKRGLKYPLEGYRHIIAYADMDGLKAANDMFGHDIGDRLLRTLAHILVHCTRKDDDIVVRRSNAADEFVLFFGAATEKKVAERLQYMRERFHEAIESHEVLRPLAGTASFSYGWEIVPNNATVEDVKAIICRSERAMYQEKKERGMERRRNFYD